MMIIGVWGLFIVGDECLERVIWFDFLNLRGGSLGYYFIL